MKKLKESVHISFWYKGEESALYVLNMEPDKDPLAGALFFATAEEANADTYWHWQVDNTMTGDLMHIPEYRDNILLAVPAPPAGYEYTGELRKAQEGDTAFNQCDGCKAGMYKDVQGMHRDDDSNPIMVCQANKYEKQLGVKMDYKNIEWISVQDAIPEAGRNCYYKAVSTLKHEDDQHTPCTINFVTHNTVVTHWAYVPEESGK